MGKLGLAGTLVNNYVTTIADRGDSEKLKTFITVAKGGQSVEGSKDSMAPLAYLGCGCAYCLTFSSICSSESP